MSNLAANAAVQANIQAVNTPLAPGANVEMKKEKDATEASTAPKFGELLNKIQAQYGAKAEAPREIKKTLGKDDFLRIMITQMRNQDPSNPFKAEQMAAEMAQFTSVEQLHNLNTNFQKMANQNQPLERMAMTQMIGKTVTIDKDRFPHLEGQKEALSVLLPRNASQVEVEILNDLGETVFKKDLGAQKAGAVPFTWDGNKLNNLPAKAGGYVMRARAVDDRGAAIEISNQGRARITGLSFEGPEPVLLVGEGGRQEKITFKNIVRIEDQPAQMGAQAQRTAGQQSMVPQPVSHQQQPPAEIQQAALKELLGKELPGTVAQVGPMQQTGASGGIEPVEGVSKRGFFTFEKGKGSMPLDVSKLPPETQAALAQLDEARAAQSAKPGFPNGLEDPEQQKASSTESTEKGGNQE